MIAPAEIRKHYGHEIVVAHYTYLDGKPEGYGIECIDCHEVLMDDEESDA